MHAPGPTSSRLTASERREQLLEVTTRIVAEQGFQAVSIESVARRAGISRPIVYEHFGDLQGLLEAVVEREMSRAFSQVSETALTDLTEGDHRELMLESLRAFLYAVRDHPSTWRLVLMPAEGAPELLRQGLARGRTVVLAQLAQAVRPIMRASESPDAELTARVLSAISDEYARLILTDPERFTPDRLVDHARWLLDKWAL
jgi:AcrR family transcriptional regulator